MRIFPARGSLVVTNVGMLSRLEAPVNTMGDRPLACHVTGRRPVPHSVPAGALMQSRGTGGWVLVALLAVMMSLPGCTRESVRVALAAQQRADQVQQAVFDRQHEALCILLYRDLHRRLEQARAPLSPAQRTALNEVWNDRDLVEFWRVQHERARALRLIGVDAKLYSDQAVVDLLYKSLSAKLARAKQGLATYAGRKVGQALSGED